MDPRIDVWNLLHDGEIAGIDGILPGKIELRIYIPYLCKMFPSDCDNDDILVSLQGCTLFSMKIWDEDFATDEFDRIVATGAEILSTDSTGFPIHVVTTRGALDMDFQSFTLAFGDGPAVSFEQLRDASQRYWTEWEKKSKGA